MSRVALEPVTEIVCGCRMQCQLVDGEKVFVFEACSPTCKWLDKVMTAAHEGHKPLASLGDGQSMEDVVAKMQKENLYSKEEG